jgi:hypothetical protein
MQVKNYHPVHVHICYEQLKQSIQYNGQMYAH